MPATMGDGGPNDNIAGSVEGPESNHLIKLVPQGKLNAQ